MNYICFVIQRATRKKIIDQNVEKMISHKKIIQLNTQLSVNKSIVALVFFINSDAIYMENAWTKEHKIALVHVFLLRSKTLCLENLVFVQIYYNIDVLFEEKYSLILYHKF